MQSFTKYTGRLAFIFGLLAIVLIASLGPGYKAGWWNFGFAFSKFPWVVYLGLGATALAILHFVTSLIAKKRIAGMALIGLLLGVSAAAVPIQMKRIAASLPFIHDITTDTANPPEFVVIAPIRADSPNPITYNREDANLQIDAYPDIKTQILNQSSDVVFAKALEIVEAMGWELVSQDQTAGRIEATETTSWFGFKDDIVIRITRLNNKTSFDIRSKSRMGKSDLGANAKRIRTFMKDLNN